MYYLLQYAFCLFLLFSMCEGALGRLHSNKYLDFQMDLLKQLKSESQNVIISPLSIFMVLSLSSNGAVGDTRNKILETIGKSNQTMGEVNSENKNVIQLIQKTKSTFIANGIFTKVKVEDSFKKIAKESYHAAVEKLISVQQVNKWCSDNTAGKIPEIINQIPPNIGMILLNAIYFKANWTNPFDASSTSEDMFNGNIPVKMMYNEMRDIHYYEDSDVQVINLPYKDGITSAIIILPKKMDTFFSSLSSNTVDYYISNMSKANVMLYLPKFKIQYDTSLRNVLSSMGMKIAFSEKANFSLINKEESLLIDDIIHKTFLEVDENGTKAAAVTAIIIGMACSPEEIDWKEMKINKPFIFILKETNNPIYLFLSKIENPQN